MQRTSDWLMSFSRQPNPRTREAEREVTKSPCHKIAISGGKGGVGKTSVALKLAQEIGVMGRRVLLIDGDTNLSNTSIKLGLPLNDSFWKLLSGEKEFSDCVIRRPHFDLLCACNGSVELFESKLHLEEVLIDIISAHEKEYDYIIVDSPAGLNKDTLTLSAWCDQRIMVVTPDRSSITDTYSMIKVLSQKYGISHNHLLVNCIQNEKQYQRVVMTLTETIQNFLNCRTHLLGGLVRLDCSPEAFDTFFLSQDTLEWNKQFSQMVKTFVDKSEQAKEGVILSKEQDVHQEEACRRLV